MSLRESDVREDLAQQRVLQCLHQIAAAAEAMQGEGGRRSSRAKMPEEESAEQEAGTPDGGNTMPGKEALMSETGNMPDKEAFMSETGNMPDKEALTSETGNMPDKEALTSETGNMPDKEALTSETGNMAEKALMPERGNMSEKQDSVPETVTMPEKEALMSERGNMPEKESLTPERGNMSEKEALKPERGNMSGKEALKPEREQQNPEVFDKQGAQKVSTPDLAAREKRTVGTDEQITSTTQNKHTEKTETPYTRQQKRGTKEQQANSQELSTETTEPTAALQEYRGLTAVQKPVNTPTHIAEKGVGTDPETLTRLTELTARLEEQTREVIQKQHEDPQTRRAENCPGTDIEALKQTPQPTTQLQEQRRQTVQKQEEDTQTRADPAEKCDEKDDNTGEDYPATQTSKEIMFVISQLKYENYLNQHCFSGDAKLPKPSDLKEEKRDRGDFDILVIHRNHGVLVGEIKSVGDRLADKSEEQQHRIIADKIRLAMKQLDKAESVLQHLFSDKARRPRIRKSVILPNVTADCLRRVLSSLPLLKEVRLAVPQPG